MTARRQPPTEALRQTARTLRLAELAQGFIHWSVLSAGGLLGLLIADRLLRLPQALRLPLALVLGGFVAIDLYRKVIRPALRPLSPARAARFLEMERGIGGNVLINAYQFERERPSGGREKFVAPLLESSSSILRDIAPRSLWWTPRLKKWLFSGAVLLVAWLLLAIVFPRYLATGIERILLPLADIPPLGNWSVEVQPSGRISLVEGDRLDISVRLKSTSGSLAQPPPPVLAWQEGSGGTESSPDTGEHALMLPTGRPGEFVFSFSAVSQPLSFRVWAEDSRSPAVQVDVVPLPQIKGSSFAVTPPAYTGLKPYQEPGPPAALTVPEGSSVRASVQLSSGPTKLGWREDKETSDFASTSGDWEITRLVKASHPYELLVSLPGQTEPRVLGQGQVVAQPDHPPAVDFVTEDRNRAVNPGGTLPVTVRASDDYGVAAISLCLAPSDDPSSTHVIKTWTYLGPPGLTQPALETYSIPLDPAFFTPGATFLLTAQATDFSPSGQKTTSRPIIVRVAGVQDMAVPQGDPLEKLFDLLKQTILQQTQANGLTDNLALHRAEAIAAHDVPKHLAGMNNAQKQAQVLGSSALDEEGKHPEGQIYQSRLQNLVKGEMGLALDQLNRFSKAADAPPGDLASLQKRQAYILNQLIALMGQMANERQEAATAAAKKQNDTPPNLTMEQELGKLKDDLKAFGDDQRRVLQATKQIRELNPEDLTTDQQAVIGELAREEAKDAAYFQEKINDLSKLPLQDFADGKLVSDMNEVYQEVQAAAGQLYQKRTDLAVPIEQGGIEKVDAIVQNLDRWLPASIGNTRMAMEEPPQASDAAMANLPSQLDDLIGDVLNKEQALDPPQDDVSSSIMGSTDKGAGGFAGDGPMSNMSAKGVTGNQLPNNDEISGRSGEGRSGKSDGQFVGNTATGKGGNETPNRMTPTPYENGSVDDKAKDMKGGGTGGGKLAGSGLDGMRGPLPPPVQEKLRLLADQQSKVRQQAESLALQLRKQRRPTGELESAVNGMKQLEAAVRNQDGLGIVQGYHQALDALAAARAAYAGDRLSHVEAGSLKPESRQDILDTQAQETPPGYEEMTSAYFRSLSESSSTNTTTSPASR